ncbi:MAG: phosphatase PAP2 family protein [Clostridiales bacterium]|nr:phosphatase PAP2 family protein [Clostridiales bacterium]
MDIDILLALQQFRNGCGAFLTDFFGKMTFLGELNTVLVIMAAVYWSVSKDFGTYLLMGWSGNRLVNGALKVTFCAYRPWIRSSDIVPYGNSMTTATGYSFPSGHTMNAATVYGGGAVHKGLPALLRVALGIIVALVALSRLYLGVHTPQDVIVGAAAGMLTMWLTLRLMRWIASHPGKDIFAACAGIALAAALAVYASVKSYPTDFDSEGKLLVDGAKMANDSFKGVGWCCAFLTGWVLERRFVRFSTDVSRLKKLTRLVTGVLSYYAVSLVLVPLLKGWVPGAAGIVVSCFFQMFYVTFLFPLCVKHFEKTSSAAQ